MERKNKRENGKKLLCKKRKRKMLVIFVVDTQKIIFLFIFLFYLMKHSFSLQFFQQK